MISNPFIKQITDRLNNVGRLATEEHLIDFNWKVVSIILTCFVLFVVNVALKTSGSSMQEWNSFVKGDTTKQVSIGSPKFIRFDEWGMHTPMLLSQVEHGFPSENPAVGALHSPLLMSLPVRTFPSILRPQLWGYFIFSPETAYSYEWNYKTFGMFMALFLLFLLLTRNRVLLSVTGSAWLMYSTFTQWWYSTPEPEMFMAVSLVFVFFVYLMYAQRLSLIIVATIGLALYSVTFLLFFYPPHQIPLAYCMAFLLVGYMIHSQRPSLMKTHVTLRIAGVALVVALLAMSLMSFLHLAQDTIQLMTKTEYPGARISTGGAVEIARYFGGYFDAFLSEKHVPDAWENICEASNFILLWPVVLVGIVFGLRKQKRPDAVIVALIACVLFLSIWMVVGYPSFIAKVTVLDRVKENRALIGVGFANVLLCILYISRVLSSATDDIGDAQDTTAIASSKTSKKRKNAPQRQSKTIREKLLARKSDLWIAIAFGIGVMLCGFYANSVTGNFFSSIQIAFSAIFFALLAWLMLVGLVRWFALLLLPFIVWNNGMVNPVVTGLSPIKDKELMKTIQTIKASDPTAKWVYYGSNIAANYFVAAGVDVVSGSKFAPDLDFLRSLDPSGENMETYNRFAQVRYMPNDSAKSASDVRFHLDNIDGYSVFVNPDNPALQSAGIRFVASAVAIPHESMGHLKPIFDHPVNNIWFYRFSQKNEQSSSSILDSLTHVPSTTRFRIGDLKIVQNATKDAFIISGIAFDAEANDIAGGICVQLDGRVIQGVYGLDNPHVSDPKYKPSAFRIVLPMAYTGSGHVQFNLQVLSKDRKSYGTIEPPLTIDIQ